MLINIATRIVIGLPRFSRERVTPLCIDLYILRIKARTNYKICLLTHKAIHCREPLYSIEMLELKESSTINLRSNHDTWKLVEHRVPGPVFGIIFTNRYFKYYAPHLYNTPPKTLRQLENIEILRKDCKHTFSVKLSTLKAKQFAIVLLRK